MHHRGRSLVVVLALLLLAQGARDAAAAYGPGLSWSTFAAPSTVTPPATGGGVSLPTTELHGVAIDSQRNVFLGVRATDGKVVMVDSTGAWVRTFSIDRTAYPCITTSEAWLGVAVDGRAEFGAASGNLYVADNCTDRVFKFAIATGSEVTTGWPLSVTDPYDLAVAGSSVYVLQHPDASGVLKYSDGGVAGTFTPPAAFPGGATTGIATDRGGSVWVATQANKLWKLDTNGSELATWTTGLSLPYGIGIDASSALWVNQGTVARRFDTSAATLSAIDGGTGAATGLQAPRFADVGPNGDFYIANYVAGNVKRVAVAGLAATEQGTAQALDAGIRLYDPDTAVTNAQVTISAGQVGGQDRLTYSGGPATVVDANAGDATVDLRAATGQTPTNADFQSALRAVKFEVHGDDPGSASRTLTVTAGDGTIASNTLSRTVTVTPVNDAPTVSASAGTTAFVEGADAASTPVAVDSAVTVADAESATLASATVSITDGFSAAQDVLSLAADSATMGNIAAAYVSGTGVLTLTSSGASATVAQWRAALRAVKYTNSSDAPSTATRTVSFAVSDGTATSSAATKLVSVTAANDTPSTGGTVTVKDPAGTGDASVAEDSMPNSANISLRPATLTDPDGSTPTAVRILSVTGGHLRTGGAGSIALGASGTALALDASSAPTRVDLQFTPDANRTTDASFTYAVVDPNDATVNSASSTATVPIAAVDDPPGVWPGSVGSFVATFGGTGGLGGKMSYPNGVALDATGKLFVAESGGNRVQVLNADGSFDRAWGWDVVQGGGTGFEVCTTASACQAGSAGSGEGQFDFPVGIAIDPQGQVYVADLRNGRVQKFTAAGVFVATLGTRGSGAGQLLGPEGLAVDGVGNVYVADNNNQRIVVFDRRGDHLRTFGRGVRDGSAAAQICTTICRAGSVGTAAGELDDPTGIAVGPGARVFVAERTGDRVQEFTAAGAPVRTFGNTGGDALQQPFGIGVDAVGNVYVTDQGASAVRQYDTTGAYVTSWGTSGTGNGQFGTLAGVAANAAGSVYVGDFGNHRVQRFGPATTAHSEGASTAVYPQAQVADVDSTQMTGATLEIGATTYESGSDGLAYAAPSGNPVTGAAFDTTTRRLSLSGTVSVAQYQAALRAVSFRTGSDNPSIAMRSVTLTATGPGASNTISRPVSVARVNDPPVVTTAPGTSAFTEGANATSTPVVVDSTVTATDVDNNALATATVSITVNFSAGQDVLTFTNAGALTHGDIAGSYDATTGVLTLTSALGTTSVAQWQAALQAVTYTNSSDTPSTANRTVSFAVSDGTASSTAATRLVSVTPVNDAPTVSASAGTTAFVEGADAASVPVAVDSLVAVADPDSATLASATVSITGNLAAAQDALSLAADSATMGNIAAAYVSGTGVLTLTSSGASATVAQWRAALRAVKYTNSSDAPSTATRTISFAAADGTATGAAATKAISVTAANDTPSAGGAVTVVAADGAALKIPRNAAATAVRIEPTALTDADGSTPTHLRILSVTGGTVAKPDGTALATGVGGARLDLTTVAGAKGADLRFRPTTGRTADATIEYAVVDADATSANSAGSSATVDLYGPPTAVVVTISGPYAAGQTLTAVPSATSETTTSWSFAWERCTADLGSCSPVGTDSAGHATSRTTDTGRRFRVTLVASNAAGAGSAVTSAATPARTPGANGEIVFASDRSGTYFSIHSVRPSGGAVRQITNEAFDQYTWGLAPDGLTIATYDFSGGTSVRPVDLETGVAAAPVAAGVAGDYSPGGGLIAYQTGGVGGADDVFVGNSDGSGSPTNLTSDSASDLDAAWSPDGTRIAFASTRAGATGYDIWVMAADGGSPARLTSGAAHETAPRFSPDGTQILYRCGTDVCKMDADGTDQVTVVSAPGSDTHPYWAPDGTRFVFESDRAGTWDIWIADVDGGNQTNLTAGTGDDVNAAWQPAQAPTAGTAVPDDTSPTFGDTLGVGGTVAAGSPVLTTTWSWQRCNSDGTGCGEVGTAAAYGVQAADVGKRLKLVKTATNAAGSDSTNSALTAVVAPQAVDLEVTDTPGAASLTTGSSITWTVAVANAASGSAPVSGATISAAVPNGVTGVTWTCSVSGSGTCANASGSGALVAQPIAALATGRTMTYVVTGTVSAGTTGTLSHTAAVTLPAQYADADGGLSDDAGTALNNVPVVTLPTVTTLAYAEQGPPLMVAGDLTLADADGGNLSGATVKVSDGRGTGDVLSVSAGSLTASFDGDTGTLAIGGSASIAAYRAVLRSVAFANTLDNPSSATRTVEVRVSDGASTSIAQTREIAFSSVPDGPVVTPTAEPLEYSDGAGSVLVDGAVALADADSTQLSGATVTITGGYDERSDLLAAGVLNGLAASWDGPAGRLTFTGTGTVATYRTALRAVRYRFTPVGAAPPRTLSFRATDADGTLGLVATRRIVIALRAPVNVAAPALSGAARESRLLTVDPGRWSGSAPLELSYRWQRCASDGGGCADIGGASGETRELTAQDVGARLRVLVSGRNVVGGPVTVSTEPSAMVVSTPLAPVFTKRPAAISSDPAPLITFTGETGAAFECELDGSGFAPCASPLALPNLPDGRHELRVRQISEGARSPVALAAWKLDTTPPATPQIVIVDGRVQVQPGGVTSAEDLAAGSFLCRIDGGEWFPCTPPYQPEGVEAGPHTIEVKFVDSAGNESTTQMDVVVVSTENADGGFVTQADGLVPRAGDDPAGGTVGVVGRALRVACILRSGDMRACRVDLFSTPRQARAVAVVAARGVRVGRGRRAAPGPGTSQMPVDVRLNAQGQSLLRAGRTTRLRFDFTIHGPRGEAPQRVTRFARVVLIRRFAVLFSGDSTRLTKATGAYVRDLAQSLRGATRAVRCVGNADDSGSAAYAQRVGLLRAQRVCAALRRAGLGAAVHAVSRGERRPRATNATPEGRALNRWVEIEVTY